MDEFILREMSLSYVKKYFEITRTEFETLYYEEEQIKLIAVASVYAEEEAERLNELTK